MAVATETTRGHFAVPVLIVQHVTGRDFVVIGLARGADFDRTDGVASSVGTSHLDPNRVHSSAAQTVTEGDAVPTVDLVLS